MSESVNITVRIPRKLKEELRRRVEEIEKKYPKPPKAKVRRKLKKKAKKFKRRKR